MAITSCLNIYLASGPLSFTILGRPLYDNIPPVDTYIGLTSLSRAINRTYEEQLRINAYPLVLTQVDSTRGDYIYRDDSTQFLDIAMGTLSPDSRKFRVDQDVSEWSISYLSNNRQYFRFPLLLSSGLLIMAWKSVIWNFVPPPLLMRPRLAGLMLL